jgi:hypothetical protein
VWECLLAAAIAGFDDLFSRENVSCCLLLDGACLVLFMFCWLFACRTGAQCSTVPLQRDGQRLSAPVIGTDSANVDTFEDVGIAL